MSYAITENQVRMLAEDLQKLTLEQIIHWNNMTSTELTYSQLPKLYPMGDLPQAETFTTEEVCDLFYQCCRVNQANATWNVNHYITNQTQNVASIGVPPPPPPPPPPGGN